MVLMALGRERELGLHKMPLVLSPTLVLTSTWFFLLDQVEGFDLCPKSKASHISAPSG